MLGEGSFEFRVREAPLDTAHFKASGNPAWREIVYETRVSSDDEYESSSDEDEEE